MSAIVNFLNQTKLPSHFKKHPLKENCELFMVHRFSSTKPIWVWNRWQGGGRACGALAAAGTTAFQTFSLRT
jgi:hypothetical protein